MTWRFGNYAKVGCITMALIWSISASQHGLARAPAGGERETNDDLKNYIVESVKIEGNNHIGTDIIRGKIKTTVNSPYDENKIVQDVRDVYSLGVFRSISVRKHPGTKPNQVVVQFTVVECPNLITDVEFRGGKNLDTSDLPSLAYVRPGLPLNPMVCNRAPWEIRQKYRENGYPLAEVALIEGGKSTDTSVIFDIQAGPHVTVREVRFVGDPRMVAQMRNEMRHNPKFNEFLLRRSNYSEKSLDDLMWDVALILSQLPRLTTLMNDGEQVCKPADVALLLGELASRSQHIVPELEFFENGTEVDIIFHLQ